MSIRVDLKRFKETIEEYEQRPVETGKVLLYGSSFFKNWGYENASEQLKDLMGCGVVNHGFGGSTGDEQLYYYKKMVFPFIPKAIVIRGGINDIRGGYSAKEAFEFSVRVAEWAKNDFPDIKIVFLSIFECPAFEMFIDEGSISELKEYNRSLKEYCTKSEYLSYLDITEFFYEEKCNIGSLKGFKNIFKEDGMHLIDEGYKNFAPYFKSKIESILGEDKCLY